MIRTDHIQEDMIELVRSTDKLLHIFRIAASDAILRVNDSSRYFIDDMARPVIVSLASSNISASRSIIDILNIVKDGAIKSSDKIAYIVLISQIASTR